ncbi:MAG: carotenoid oxygenase family protein [Burkholderiales bacterium]|nr:carotenoid oxygenase family protein [Burkholderiales bacterium]
MNTLSRRSFCRQLLSLSAGAVAFPALASPVFAKGMQKPWAIAYAGINDDLPGMAMRVTGKIPATLTGTLFRNGPAQYTLGGERYQHPFDGDGLIQKYRIAGNGITHEARFVQTEKYVAEKRAQRFLRVSYGTHLSGRESIEKPDASNTANTSVIYHQGELLALWEGGSATRLDPASLDTHGFKTWRRDYAGMPFSAHPRIEPDGSLWNFGVSSFNGMLSIYRISRSGELLAAHTSAIPNITMVHDFAVTARHLVFLLPPLVFDLERLNAGNTMADSYVWRPELGMRVLVVDKNDLTSHRWFELPSSFVFHIGNAWEDGGKIYLDYVGSPSAWWVLTGARQLMRGEWTFEEAKKYMPRLALAEIDLVHGKATQSFIALNGEFPAIDPRLVGKRHHSLYTVARLGQAERPGFDAIARFDRNSGKIAQFRYGDDYLVEEHLFVPRADGSSDTDGWLIGTALDIKQQAMVLSIFEAGNLAQGPVAQARMDRIVPVGFHGTYVAG